MVELLLEQRDEITAADIAAEVGASTRTIHRELSDIELVLAANHIKLHKRSGIGIKIEADSERLERFKQALEHADLFEYSAEERKALILCRLLKHTEPIKQFSLSHQLRVTMPTISHDLDELEQMIRDHGLTLVRRRGYGVEISGPEPAKRLFIAWLAQTHLDESDLFGQAQEAVALHPLSKELLAMVGRKHFFSLEQAFWKLEDGWQLQLSEKEHLNLLIRLAVTMTRIQEGHLVPPHVNGALPSYSARGGSKAEELLRMLAMDLPSEEVRYIAKLLKATDSTEEDGLLLAQGDWTLSASVTKLIAFMEEQLGEPFTEDRSLREGLQQHMLPAFRRIEEGSMIRNPLLAQIKKDYELLFTLIRKGVNAIVSTIEVPDEEIGYMVMHFGASMERLKQFPRKVRAVLVCTSGIGSSKLLAVRISKELPQIELIGNRSWYEAARMPEQQYDLIISTVDLPIAAERYIKLSPLLLEAEVERLRSFIQNITLKHAPSPNTPETSSHSPLERLMQLKMYASDAVMLLETFQVYTMPERPGLPRDDLTDVTEELIESIRHLHAVTDEQKVVHLLLTREQHGSQVIPDTELALFHTRSDAIAFPVLSLFRFNEPLPFGDSSAAPVKQILMMLGPAELRRTALEILSEVSAMLLMTELTELLKHGSAAEIQAFISFHLEKEIKFKLDWRNEP
ncbi:BglG family transcription antiterminator [Paenibacillus algorifonticola]|uniref:BglG family transcription antiterminator n=1 Tax=Paenibacillus algorifonticola TaxID=684063 RepID=UPI0022B0CC90|nr:BglG family transcription antiterminator [Paenibacillus algorifonticola]